jgi:hypothetical protein
MAKASRKPAPLDIVEDRTPEQLVADGDAPRSLSYQSRIRIVEAWRYPGSLRDAPPFIDPNWAAWGDPDDDRGLTAGPALRIPARSPTGEKLARIGDYVVRQEVALTSELSGEIEVDVWPADQFERLFMPTTEKPFRPFNPPNPTDPQDHAAGKPLPHSPESDEDLTGENGDPRLPTGGEG